jgi:hypothetical protein
VRFLNAQHEQQKALSAFLDVVLLGQQRPTLTVHEGGGRPKKPSRRRAKHRLVTIGPEGRRGSGREFDPARRPYLAACASAEAVRVLIEAAPWLGTDAPPCLAYTRLTKSTVVGSSRLAGN